LGTVNSAVDVALLNKKELTSPPKYLDIHKHAYPPSCLVLHHEIVGDTGKESVQTGEILRRFCPLVFTWIRFFNSIPKNPYAGVCPME
jgi:hypothetical protein